MMKLVALAGVVVLAGCASTTEITSIGNGHYILGGQGASTTWSGSAVKVDLIQKASKYCESQGKRFALTSDKGQDASMYDYSSAEIKFRCE